MRSVRMIFKKGGTAKYISHLDLNRCFTRAVRRAGLDVWYTEGFNPHPYLFFPAPLPLGVSSECEMLDIKINGEMTNEEIKKRMTLDLPQGVEVLRVYDPVDDASLLCAARYEIELVFDGAQEARSFCDGTKKAIADGNLKAKRPGKSGGRKVMKEINVCELVNSLNATCEGDAVRLDAVLACGNVGLSVLLFVSCVCDALGAEYTLCSTKRVRFYKNNFSEFN